MALTQQEIRFQFLNSIMKENKVSIKSISDCMQENKNTIDNMGKIFDSDDSQSVRKRFVLLKLISRSNAQRNLYYYQKEYNIDTEIETDVETYKTLIIAALMDNIEFYVSACNWCGLIQREVIRQQEKTKSCADVEPYIKEVAGWIFFTFPLPIHKYGADGEDAGFSQFLEIKNLKYKDPNEIKKDISGTLLIMTNNQNEAKFEFSFDRFQLIIPYEIEVRFTTKHDPKKHVINIPADSKHCEKNREKGITKIKTDIIGDIDLSEGMLENWEVVFKPIDD